MKYGLAGFALRDAGFPGAGYGFAAVAAVAFLLALFCPAFAESQPAFTIRSFVVEGNTILPGKKVLDLLQQFKGKGKTAGDVEKARDALEKMYHDAGYPAVIVTIPQQTTEGAMIRLHVIESTIGRVKVTGNQYFTREAILRDLPSLAPGKVIYVPDVQEDLARTNRNPDLKASPVLSAGEETGLTDVEIKVQDELPLHGNLELNNRSTPNTTDLRLNAQLHYDNLWQRDHSLSAQFQTSPQDTGQVRLYALSYTLPAPWNEDHQLALYGLRSDSNTTVFGQGLLVTGKGEIIGTRYVIPLPPYQSYVHNLTVGFDFKHFEQSTGFTEGEGLKTPITYLPVSFSYNSSLPDSCGNTSFSTGLNAVFRGLVSEESKFSLNRYDALGDYLYMTAGVERNFKLPAGMGAYLKLDGQLADQPLIPNEQFVAGGMTSVRGYQEAAAMGDNGLHGTAELSGPDIGQRLVRDKLHLTPYFFYDYARLVVTSSLPSQTAAFTLEGAGAGFRGTYGKYWYYELDYACPLSSQSDTDKYRQRWYFKTGAQF